MALSPQPLELVYDVDSDLMRLTYIENSCHILTKHTKAWSWSHLFYRCFSWQMTFTGPLIVMYGDFEKKSKKANLQQAEIRT